MKLTCAIPRDVKARFFVTPDDSPYECILALAVPPLQAEPYAIRQASVPYAELTHEEGQRWPDPYGASIMAMVLAEGGGALLSFASLADAIAFKWRMEAGRG